MKNKRLIKRLLHSILLLSCAISFSIGTSYSLFTSLTKIDINIVKDVNY